MTGLRVLNIGSVSNCSLTEVVTTVPSLRTSAKAKSAGCAHMEGDDFVRCKVYKRYSLHLFDLGPAVLRHNPAHPVSCEARLQWGPTAQDRRGLSKPTPEASEKDADASASADPAYSYRSLCFSLQMTGF